MCIIDRAANDDDIQLNYVSTGVFASEDEEKALIEREVENGADGIIVQLVSSEDTYACLLYTSGRKYGETGAAKRIQV